MPLPIHRALVFVVSAVFVATTAVAMSATPAAPTVRSGGPEPKTSCTVSLQNNSGQQPNRLSADKGPGDRWSPDPPFAIRDGNGGTGAFYRSADDPGHGCYSATRWKLNYGQDCPLKSTPPSPCIYTVVALLRSDGKGGFNADVSCEVTKAVISCPRVKLEHKDGSPKLEVVYDICYQRKCGRH